MTEVNTKKRHDITDGHDDTTTPDEKVAKTMVTMNRQDCQTKQKIYLPPILIKEVISRVKPHTITLRHLAHTCQWIRNFIVEMNPKWRHQAYSRVILSSLVEDFATLRRYINIENVQQIVSYAAAKILLIASLALKDDSLSSFNYLENLFETVKYGVTMKYAPLKADFFESNLISGAIKGKKWTVVKTRLPAFCTEIKWQHIAMIYKHGTIEIIEWLLNLLSTTHSYKDPENTLHFVFKLIKNVCLQNDKAKFKYALRLASKSGSLDAYWPAWLQYGSLDLISEAIEFCRLLPDAEKLLTFDETDTLCNYTSVLKSNDESKIKFYSNNFAVPQQMLENFLVRILQDCSLQTIKYLISTNCTIIDANEAITINEWLRTCNTAVTTVLKRGDFEIFEWLVGIGPRMVVDQTTRTTNELLFLHQNIKIHSWLYEKGYAYDMRGLACDALERNDISLLEWFVSIGGRFSTAEMHEPVSNGNVPMLKIIYSNLERDEILAHGSTLLDTAAEYGHLETMKWLFSIGCLFSARCAKRASARKNRTILLWLKSKDCPRADYWLQKLWPNCQHLY